MADAFKLCNFTSHDKRIQIYGPDNGYYESYIEIDNDDVDHDGTRALAELMIATLNKHWDQEAFEKLSAKYRAEREQRREASCVSK